MGRGIKSHLLDYWKPSECSLTTMHWIHEFSLPTPKANCRALLGWHGVLLKLSASASFIDMESL